MLSDKELEIIRRKMAQLEVEPPAQAWSKIKAEIQPKPRFRAAGWLAGSFFLLGLLFFLKFSTQRIKDEPVNLAKVSDSKNPPATDFILPESKTATGISLKNKSLISTSTGALNPPRNKTTTSRPVAPRLLVHRKNKGANFKSARLVPGLDQPAINNKSNSTEPERSNLTNTTSENPFSNQAESTTPVDSAITTQRFNGSKKDSAATKPTVAGQGKNQPEKREEWLLGLVLAPTYAFKIMVPQAGDSLAVTPLKNRNRVNPERIGLELGLQFTKPLTSQLHLEVGLSWLKLKENFSYRQNNWFNDTLRDSRQLISSFDYGGARVGFAYYFRERPKSKFNVMLTGGANRLLGGKTEQYANGQLLNSGSTSSSNNVLAKSNYNVSVGWGYTRPLNSDFEIRVMPSFNYYFGSVYTQQTPFRLRPYSVGLHVTFKRNFSRKPKSKMPL